jgi:hypothetical protein
VQDARGCRVMGTQAQWKSVAQGVMHVFAHCETSHSGLLLLGVGCVRIAKGVCKCRLLRTQGMSCSALH